MDKLRLRFEKTGRAVYISHLDLMATLSVGTASVCELMDFRLQGEADLSALPMRLTDALPEGLRVQEAYPCERKSAELKWLDVRGRLEYDRGLPDPEELAAFFAQPEIVIEKKTKRGIGMTDIRPAVERISLCPEDGCIRLDARISAQEPTLNPELLAGALRPELAPDFAAFTRLETYDREHRIYR